MRTNLAKAVRRGLEIEVLKRGKIETTLALAKSVQGEIDKLINLAKKNSVNARRQVVKILGQDIFITGDFSKRNSGYTRIIKLGQRFSDAAEMAILELIDYKKPEEKTKSTETKIESGETLKKPKK